MLMLMAKSLARRQSAGVEVLGYFLERKLSTLGKLRGISVHGCDLAVVSEKLLEVLGAQNVDFGKE